MSDGSAGPCASEDDERPLRLRENAVAWRGEDGETIALDLANATYLGVNATGTLLWESLAGGTTRRQLIQRLCERYDLPAARAADDVDCFLRACKDRGYLQS